MSCAVFAFPECRAEGAALAHALSIDCRSVSLHAFPDGESRVRVSDATETALLYRSLDRPNGKIFELLLAAAALRDGGARRVVLVVPYLAYMRQDRAFHSGEAVSQRVLGSLLAAHCDALITLDPHLHRVRLLAEVMPGIEAVGASAGAALAAALEGRAVDLLIGPDGESAQWVEAIARLAGLPFVLGEKRRRGDRTVELAIRDAGRAAGRDVVLIDDLISSGTTLSAAAHILRQAGARSVSALATHCLASEADLAALGAAGISSIRSTRSVAGPTASIPIASVLAQEIRGRGWCGGRA